MWRLALGAAVAVVLAAGAVAIGLGRADADKKLRDPRACRLERGAVYAFIGVGDDFRTAIIDVAHPDAPCVDRQLPREARNVGVRGSDGALLYLDKGRLFRAVPEKGAWSELHHAFTYPRTTPPDPEIETRACGGKIEGLLTAPDSERVVYWCGDRRFHDVAGKDLALEAKDEERPIALGYDGRVLAVRDRGVPALVVLGPMASRAQVNGVELRFARAALPVRAVADGFLILLPKDLGRSHEMFHVDFQGRARREQRYEDLPEAEIGSLALVIDEDAGLHAQTPIGPDGAEAVVRFPPGNKPIEVIYRPTGGQRFASSSLFTAP